MTTQQILSSDSLHNRNCYMYFQQLKIFIPPNVMEEMKAEFASTENFLDEYDEAFTYGDFYTRFIESIELIIKENFLHFTKKEFAKFKVNHPSLIPLFLHIYDNDNQILATPWLKDYAAQTRPAQLNQEHRIAQALQDPPEGKKINRLSPQNMGGLKHRFLSVYSKTFKPQETTNLPSIKLRRESLTEYRFGTQAQRDYDEGVVVNPFFKLWLLIQADKAEASHQITHVYFNNLGYKQSGHFDMQGKQEIRLTDCLHDLESNPDLKVAVITLPAKNEKLMSSTAYRYNEDKLPYEQVRQEFFNTIQSNMGDFIISKRIRALLFPHAEESIFNTLLDKSFFAQGVHAGSFISTAQKQAIWIHFIKYELTKYVIDTLKPQSYNFSCKDAIDRGALSSTYYNLMKSWEAHQTPMKKEAFECSLDAAAATVKGRGMNFHRRILWNALNYYINFHYEDLVNNPDKSWLIYWRDMNCPPSRVNELIEIRGEQCNSLINSKEERIHLVGKQLMDLVKRLSNQNISGKNLLLEVIARTSELINNPTPKSISNYKKLAQELEIHHPAFMFLGGIMKTLVGTLLFVPSLGYSKKIISQGVGNCKAGFYAHARAELIQAMNDFSQLQEPHISC